MPAPALDDDLGFAQGVEDFSVEQFVAQSSIEAFDVAVLPRAAGLDVSGLGPNSSDPVLHRLGHEFGAVVRTDVTRHAAKNEEVGQDVDHVDRLELAIDADRQAFMGELVDDVEHPVFAALMGAILDEVVGPDVIGILGPQADAGPVCQPQTAAFLLFLGDLQPLPFPDPLDPPVTDRPAGLPQQGSDLAIAIAAILAGELDDIGCQLFGILSAPRGLALR